MKYILSILSIVLLVGCATQKNTVADLSVRQQRQFDEYYFEGAKQKILGNQEEAIKQFKEALKVHPSSHAAMYQLAGLMFEEGNLPGAIFWAEKAIENNPDFNFWYYGQLGQFYNQNLQFDKSAAVFEQMIKAEPDKMSNYIEALNQYLNMRDGKNALHVLDMMDKQFGITSESAVRRKDILFALGRVDEAVQAIKDLVDAHPDELTFRGMYAETLVEADKEEDAIQAYKDVLSIDSLNGIAHMGLAELYRNADQNDLAYLHLKKAFEDQSIPIGHKLNMLAPYFLIIRSSDEMLQQAEELSMILVRQHPNDAMSYLALSDVYNVAQRWNDSREYLLQAMEISQADFRMWQKLLTLDEQLNSFRMMADDSEKALVLFPNQTVLYLYNSFANMMLEDYEKALRSANDGLDVVIATDDRVNLLTTIADAHNKLGQYSKSDEAFEEILELDPGNQLALNNYAYYLALRNEKLDKALQMIEKVIAINPNNPSYLDTYGWVLYQMGRYKDAEIQLKKALEVADESAEVLEHYGKILIKLERVEEGNQYLQKASEIKKKEQSILN